MNAVRRVRSNQRPDPENAVGNPTAINCRIYFSHIPSGTSRPSMSTAIVLSVLASANVNFVGAGLTQSQGTARRPRYSDRSPK